MSLIFELSADQSPVSTIFVVFRDSWAYIFNDDPGTSPFFPPLKRVSKLMGPCFLYIEVVASVSDILPLVALFQVVDGTAAVAGGILRAQGKQLTGAVLNLSAYYIIGIPFGILLGFKYGMGLHGIWIGLTVSLVYCAVLGTWIGLRTDWEHQVEKVQKRLAAERVNSRKAGGIEEGSEETDDDA